EKPAIVLSETEERQRSVKVIRLDEHRENGRGGLSSSERSAFREIGERLRQANEALARAETEGRQPSQDVSEACNTNQPVKTSSQEGASVAAPAEDEPEQTAQYAEEKGKETQESLALESGKQDELPAPSDERPETPGASAQAEEAWQGRLAEEMAPKAGAADTA